MAYADGQVHLRVQVVVLTRDPQTVETLKASLPRIQNDVLLLLSAENPNDLLTAEGKKSLKKKILKKINAILGEDKPEAEEILFSSFVVD